MLIHFTRVLVLLLFSFTVLSKCDKETELTGDGCMWTVEAAWIGYNCILVGIAGCLVSGLHFSFFPLPSLFLGWLFFSSLVVNAWIETSSWACFWTYILKLILTVFSPQPPCASLHKDGFLIHTLATSFAGLNLSSRVRCFFLSKTLRPSLTSALRKFREPLIYRVGGATKRM